MKISSPELRTAPLTISNIRYCNVVLLLHIASLVVCFCSLCVVVCFACVHGSMRNTCVQSDCIVCCSLIGSVLLLLLKYTQKREERRRKMHNTQSFMRCELLSYFHTIWSDRSLVLSQSHLEATCLITGRHDKCLRWHKRTRWITFNYYKPCIGRLTGGNIIATAEARV